MSDFYARVRVLNWVSVEEMAGWSGARLNFQRLALTIPCGRLFFFNENSSLIFFHRRSKRGQLRADHADGILFKKTQWLSIILIFR